MRLVFMSFFVLGVLLMSTAPASCAESKQGVLLVAFGTSQEDALRSYAAIEADFRSAFGEQPLAWAFTSKIIRTKMAKAGKTMLSIEQALDSLAKQGVKALKVQSLHVTSGEEFGYMERAVLAHVMRNPGQFDSVTVGRPLLESLADREAVIFAVLASLPAERTAADAVVFMGHGQEHGRGEMILQSLASGLSERDPLAFFATVEGAISFDGVREALQSKGIKKVWLQPFMIVAGEHAKNDMLGDEDDSWASQLKAAGMDVQSVMRGLGELAGIRALFVKHAQEGTGDVAALKAD